MLYAFAGISSHQVPKVMQLAGLLWKGITDSIPSHVTVLEWVEKCGLSLTRGCMKKKTARRPIPSSSTTASRYADKACIWNSEYPPDIPATVSVSPM